MKKLISVLTVLALTVQPLMAAREDSNYLKVVAMSGEVKVCRDAECSPATIGRVLQVGETIQTSSGSRAVLRVGRDTFELRERSKIVVDRLTRRENRFNMLLGTLKAKIAASFFGRKTVSVVTTTGVMAVRGTEFIASVSEGGDVRLDVLYGRVDFLDKVTGKIQGSFVQGESGNARAAGEGEAATNMEKAAMEPEAFHEAFGGQEGFDSYKKNDEENKESARRFESGEAAKVAEAVSVVRENDLASGRTLRDRFGNLARVEQRLFRPSADEIQFVNIIKRNEYRYAGYFAKPSTLGSGARMDYMEARIRFDRGLPDNIMEWPSFFADAGDSLNVLSAKTKIANNKPSAAYVNSDFIELTAVYNPVKDELGGIKCGAGQTLGTQCFQETVIGYNDGTNYVRHRVSECGNSGVVCTQSGGVAVTPVAFKTDGSGNGDMFSTNVRAIGIIDTTVNGVTGTDPLLTAGDNTLWMMAESYAINNDGSLLNIHSVLGSNISDPFAYLRTVAGHGALTIGYGSYSNVTKSATNTLFRRGNIDLIFIPDLAVDLVQRFAAQLE